MIKDMDIICISWLVWDSIPLVMHHMARMLAKENRVLFVDPPVAYSNLVMDRTLFKGHSKKTAMWWKGLRKENENLHVYYPPPLLLQYGHLDFADRVNQAITSHGISRAARSLGFKNPVLWIYHPYAVFPNGQFNEKVVCYDCNDDVGYFFSYHFNKRERLSAMEARLAERADLVFATSRYLYDLRKSQNPATYHLPSGIDIGLFRQAALPDLPIAEELQKFKKPVMGFVGGMANAKMNWEWIGKAAESRPDWSFVFIGPCADTPPKSITDKKNINFIGARSQETLPAYIKGFDVCLIPYQGEEFLRACQPTKTYEYWAAGKPVVAAWIPELEENRDIVRLSRNYEDFIANLEAALSDGKNPEMVQKYTMAAGRFTWDERLEKASRLILSRI